jgi:hypothetical protein
MTIGLDGLGTDRLSEKLRRIAAYLCQPAAGENLSFPLDAGQ